MERLSGDSGDVDLDAMSKEGNNKTKGDKQVGNNGYLFNMKIKDEQKD